MTVSRKVDLARGVKGRFIRDRLMTGVFTGVGWFAILFIALIFMREESLLIGILDRVTRSAPIFFLVASVYYESRFDFYDLVVVGGGM